MTKSSNFASFITENSEFANLVTMLPKEQDQLRKFIKYQEKRIRHNCVILIMMETITLIIKIILHFVYKPYHSEETVIYSLLALALMCGLYALTMRVKSLIHFIGFILLFNHCMFELILMVGAINEIDEKPQKIVSKI